jgi:hypothetical protein
MLRCPSIRCAVFRLTPPSLTSHDANECRRTCGWMGGVGLPLSSSTPLEALRREFLNDAVENGPNASALRNALNAATASAFNGTRRFLAAIRPTRSTHGDPVCAVELGLHLRREGREGILGSDGRIAGERADAARRLCALLHRRRAARDSSAGPVSRARASPSAAGTLTNVFKATLTTPAHAPAVDR